MEIHSFDRKCPSKQRCSYSVHFIFFCICMNANKVSLLLWCCRWLEFSEKECTTLLLVANDVYLFSIYQYSNKITVFLASLENLFATWWIIIIITTVIIKLEDYIEYLWYNNITNKMFSCIKKKSIILEFCRICLQLTHY